MGKFKRRWPLILLVGLAALGVLFQNCAPTYEANHLEDINDLENQSRALPSSTPAVESDSDLTPGDSTAPPPTSTPVSESSPQNTIPQSGTDARPDASDIELINTSYRYHLLRDMTPVEKDYWLAELENVSSVSRIDLRIRALPECLKSCALALSANSPLLFHQTGVADGTNWFAQAGAHSPRLFLVYGPYIKTLPPRSLTASFSYQAKSASSTSPVATLEIYEANSQKILVSQDVFGEPVGNVLRTVQLRFSLSATLPHAIETRVFWHGTGDMRISRIEVR
jgi:hypothetical protein